MINSRNLIYTNILDLTSKLTEIIRNLTKENSNKKSLECWFNNILGSSYLDNLTELN